MAVLTTNNERDRKGRMQHWARKAFFLVLFAWNVLVLSGVAYTLWIRHHPRIQTGASNVVLSVELDLLIVGNLVILAVGLIVRQIARRRPTSTVA
jgi:hypothetical protein